MSALGPAAILIVVAALFFMILFFYFIPLGLWTTALSSGVHVRIFSDLVGMRLRKVPPDVIVRSKITAFKAGIPADLSRWEAHYMAGGNVPKAVNGLSRASKANIELNFDRAA